MSECPNWERCHKKNCTEEQRCVSLTCPNWQVCPSVRCKEQTVCVMKKSCPVWKLCPNQDCNKLAVCILDFNKGNERKKEEMAHLVKMQKAVAAQKKMKKAPKRGNSLRERKRCDKRICPANGQKCPRARVCNILAECLLNEARVVADLTARQEIIAATGIKEVNRILERLMPSLRRMGGREYHKPEIEFDREEETKKFGKP